MSERDQIYVQILHFGLISLRNRTNAGDIQYCAIEVEHLHEVPSLIGEMNEARHEYYLRGHRGLYLERVDQTKESLGFVLNRYRELWPQLEAIHSQSVADA
jgi:hypothetical protein